MLRNAIEKVAALTHWDSHLRPLIGVLTSLRAVNPGAGCDVRLCHINGVERPVLVVFGRPWVIWLYIDSGTYMLRGGHYASERLTQPLAPAAVPAGRIGSSETDLPAKMMAMIHQVAATVPEQPADKYSWYGMVGCIGHNEGMSASFIGPYKELLAPLINLSPAPEGSKLFPKQAPVTQRQPSTPSSGPRGSMARPEPHQPTQSIQPAPPHPGTPVVEESAPVLERPGLIPGIAGAAALLLAVLPLEYSFYGLIRWVVFVSGIWLVTLAAKHQAYLLMCCYIVAAALWNPFVPFGFSRAAWLVPDLMGAALMGFGAYALVAHRPTGRTAP